MAGPYRFSDRFDETVRPNRLSLLVDRKRLAGEAILDLTESNPTRTGLAPDVHALLEPLRDPAGASYDPCPAGIPEARRAVAAYYAERGYEVDPDQIILTASTSEAYSYAFRLLTNPGDEVLAPAPSYPLFEHLARMDCLTLRHYPLRYDHAWWLDVESLVAAVTPRTRIVLAVSPNNPTGSYLKRGELAQVLEICRRHDLALVVDEVFTDYLHDERIEGASAVGTDSVPVIVTSGLSKVLCLPQMKLAWMVIAGPEAWKRQARERLEWIADTYLSVATPVQLAAGEWLARREELQRPMLERIRTNLGWLRGAAVGTAAELLHVEGGWYAVLRLPRTRSEEEWALALLGEDGVLVQPGYFFDFPEEAYAVVSLITPEETLREGVEKLFRRL